MSTHPAQDYAIHTEGLTRRYGYVKALVDLDLSVPYGSIFGYLGKSVLFSAGVRRFRAIQTELDRIEIQIEAGPGFDRAGLDDLSSEIRLRIGEDVRVEFREVPRIHPEKSGKLRYFHSALEKRGET